MEVKQLKNFKYFLCAVMYAILMCGVIFSPNVTYLRIMGVIGMSAVFYNAIKELSESK
jgi:hypothetical protein